MQKPILFTKSGLDELVKEQKELQEKRKGAVAELKRTRELGDLSENGAYKAARFKLSGIDRRLVQIALALRRARVVDRPTLGLVGIGSVVTVEENDSSNTYEIVGGYESDPIRHKISHFSPLGKALLGKKLHDEVTFHTPEGEKKLQITSIA